MNKSFIKLGIALIIVLILHVFYYMYQEIPLGSHRLFLAYGINYVAVIALLLFLNKIKSLVANSLGFVFLIGSFIKIALYFLLFQPHYKADETVTKLEFFTFFIPYFVCLIGETLFFKKLTEES